jgi:hypothetical protein
MLYNACVVSFLFVFFVFCSAISRRFGVLKNAAFGDWYEARTNFQK